MPKRTPLWSRMIADGYAETREDATRWILTGAVRVGGQPATHAGQMIAADDALEVRGFDQRYVNKGGLKLEGALDAFGIAVEGRVCIDAGASTGGFTDCLTQRGAARVYAVDVGFGQLAGRLRQNPVVVNLERTNISDAVLLSLEPCPTLGTVDLSYLSLRQAVPAFDSVLRTGGELICLVKPLFEIDDAEARRTGHIAPDAFVPLLLRLADDLRAQGHGVCGVCHSPVTGNAGTIEFFLHVALHAPERSMAQAAFAAAAENAVEAARTLTRFHKGTMGLG